MKRDNVKSDGYSPYEVYYALKKKMSQQHQEEEPLKVQFTYEVKDDIPPIFYRHYASYKNGTLNISELSRVCNISRTTAYKYLSLLE